MLSLLGLKGAPFVYYRPMLTCSLILPFDQHHLTLKNISLYVWKKLFMINTVDDFFWCFFSYLPSEFFFFLFLFCLVFFPSLFSIFTHSSPECFLKCSFWCLKLHVLHALDPCPLWRDHYIIQVVKLIGTHAFHSYFLFVFYFGQKTAMVIYLTLPHLNNKHTVLYIYVSQIAAFYLPFCHLDLSSFAVCLTSSQVIS